MKNFADVVDLKAINEISEQQGRVARELLAASMDPRLASEVSNANGKRLKAEVLKLAHAEFKNFITHKSSTVALGAERLSSLIENKSE